MTLCAGYLQTAARQFDDGKPFRIRPAIASDIDALLQLEAESWWQESRWSRERILASIRRGSRISSAEETSGRLDVTHALSSPPTGSNQTTEGSITSEREAPGDDVERAHRPPRARRAAVCVHTVVHVRESDVPSCLLF